MQSLIVKSFSLKHTIESGQFFSFSKTNGSYFIMTQDSSFFVKQEKNKLFFNCNKKFAKTFFGLNENYDKILKKMARDEHMRKLTAKYYGLRVMKQNPWQCIISFICSSASNVPKIMKNVGLLSKQFGEKSGENYLFPKIGELNDLKKLKNCGVGFRAKYLHETNKIVDEEWLIDLQKMNYLEAKQKLAELPGVGEKIADCVCLFSLGHYDAFPVDVWIKRIMEQTYFGRKTSNKEIVGFARNYFGDCAGYAQQYLYHGGRMNGKT